jgi:uncharacterized membrane protein
MFMKNQFLHVPLTGSSQVNVGRNERIASVAGAALLLGTAFRHMQKRPVMTFAQILSAGYLLYRGATGYCPLNAATGRNTAHSQPGPLEIKESVTLRCTPHEAYHYWRQLEHLPLFMKYIEAVQPVNGKLTHWTMRLPKAGTVEWYAEITEDLPGNCLRWQSLAGSDIDHAGEILFREAPGNRGTEVHATITYRLPAGAAGRLAGSILNKVFEMNVRADLHRFKQLMETGEIVTVDGQPAARKTSTFPTP